MKKPESVGTFPLWFSLFQPDAIHAMTKERLILIRSRAYMYK